MKTSDKFLNYLKENELFYMKDETNRMFDIPYKLDESNNVRIHIEIEDDTNTIRVGFLAPLFNESEKTKNEILLLNPRLIKGAMGISSLKPGFLEYSLAFSLNEEEDMSEEIYTATIEFCLSLYKNLMFRKIIKDMRNNGK